MLYKFPAVVLDEALDTEISVSGSYWRVKYKNIEAYISKLTAYLAWERFLLLFLRMAEVME
jgi:hypothetical protein